MPKRFFALLCGFLLLTGCQSGRRVETASVIEDVSVCARDGKLSYTFYLLTDSDKPETVSVPASSFEEARRLARERYIPNLTLAKLELLLIERGAFEESARGDIEYISTQSSFSPAANIAVCDEKTLRRLKRDPSAQELIKRQIELLRQEEPRVRSSCLAVFNSFDRGESFFAPLITCDGELSVSAVEIER